MLLIPVPATCIKKVKLPLGYHWSCALARTLSLFSLRALSSLFSFSLSSDSVRLSPLSLGESPLSLSFSHKRTHNTTTEDTNFQDDDRSVPRALATCHYHGIIGGTNTRIHIHTQNAQNAHIHIRIQHTALIHAHDDDDDSGFFVFSPWQDALFNDGLPLEHYSMLAEDKRPT